MSIDSRDFSGVTSPTAAELEARIVARKERLADNLTALGDDLKDQVNHAVHRVGHKVEAEIGRLTDKVEDGVGRVGQKLEGGVDYVCTNLGDGINSVSGQVDAALNKVRHTFDLKAQIEERPLVMVGAAVGVGFVASHLLKPRPPVQRWREEEAPARSSSLLASFGSLAFSLIYPAVATAAQGFVSDYLQKRSAQTDETSGFPLH